MPQVAKIESIKGLTPLYQDDPVGDTNPTILENTNREAPYRYKDLSDGDYQLVDSILKGWLPIDQLPSIKSRVIRVYVSSTCTDMEQERNTIISRAYPLLRAYCRERYDLEFKVVDMKWGLQTGAQDDHSSTDLCMEEIMTSQQDSIGPNFVAFVGQKYGLVDLPRQLSHDEFEPIRAAIKAEKTDEDINFLDEWYKKDTNSVPTVYVLQPISAILGNETSDWVNIDRRLRSLLLFGVDKAVAAGQVSQDIRNWIKASVTEQEIKCGIFDTESKEYNNSNVLCIVRDIPDLERHLDRKMVTKFIDQLPGTTRLDQVKKEAVTVMKNRIYSAVGESNVKHYDIRWRDPQGTDPEFHKDYLTQLNTDFYNKMRDMIDQNVANQTQAFEEELYAEVIHQWDFAKTRCRNFTGREEILEQISAYLLDDTSQPLVLHGQPGFGKTSIMSKAASEVTSYLQQDGLTVLPYIVLRSCGTSADSCNIRQLLYSLAHQLAYATDKYRHQIPKDFKLLKGYFKDILQRGNFPGMVIIFIDALNQLSDEDNAHKLDWLPSKIAKNMKVIVSSISGDDNCLYQKLRSKITNERYYIEVTEMSSLTCGEILRSSLDRMGRIVSFHQMRLIREVFNKCTVPLFAKLTFEEVLDWKSYMDMPPNALTVGVSACIQRLFQKLEEKHGKVLVSHTLGYMTASQGGISESEIEDVLSLDDKVLNSVFTTWQPALRRIPPILFQRIKHDVAGYIHERDCDKTTVIYWYQQQFVKEATDRYLSQSDIAHEVHNNMADYYLGTWSRMKEKPFVYDTVLAKLLHIRDLNSSAVRYVPTQPLLFETYNIEARFNYRKLNQMAYHLAKANRFTDLYENALFNYDFLRSKIRACSVQKVISDFSMVDEKEVLLVADALRLSEAAVALDDKLLGIELSGRLLPYYHHYKNIRSLIRQCDINSLQSCPIVPNWQVFTTPCGPLQYVCEADTSINSEVDVQLVQSHDNTVLLTAKPINGRKMRVWDITQGEPQPDLLLPIGSRSYSTPNGVYVNLFKGKQCLQTYRMDSGELYGDVNFPSGNIHQVRTNNKYVAFTFEQSPGPVVIDIEAHMLIHRFQYQAKAVAISNDQKYLVTNNGKTLAFHLFPMMERICMIDSSHAPEIMLFSSDHKRFYVQDTGHELKCIRVNPTLKKAKTTEILRDIELKTFKLSHSEDLILARASRSLYLVDAHSEKILHRITSMPSGVFIERLSTFKDAGFSPKDDLVMAARHIYLGVWCTKTGQPLRLLQTSVSPVMNLYTSDTVNRAITLLEDRTIQVWNFDNLDHDVQHLNAIIGGPIKCLSSSPFGNRVICCGNEHAEGRILNLRTYQCEWTLEHTDEIGRQLDDVIMSPCGNFAVTRMENDDYPGYLKPWKELKEDKVWDMSTGAAIQMITGNRYVVFSPNDDKVIFFVCRNYDPSDWSMISYDLIGMALEGENAFETFSLGLPDGDVIGNPIITESGQFLAFILQSKEETTSSMSFKNQLIVYSFEKLWYGLKYLNLADMWNGFQQGDCMVDIQLFNNDSLLVTYGHNFDHFNHSPDGTFDRSKHIYKASFLYNVRDDNMIKRLDDFLHPNTDIAKILLSDQRSFVLDQSGKVFSTIDNEHVNTLDLNVGKTLPGCICLIMDGRYAAMLSSSRRELLIERTNDGVCKAKMFLHGVADHIQVGQNNRTIIIGCRDGRILSFSVVLELTDHMQELINILPSRSGNVTYKSNDNTLTLKSDIRNIQTTQNLQKKLSTITRERIMIEKKKQGSLKSVGHAVLLTQELGRVRESQSCVLQ